MAQQPLQQGSSPVYRPAQQAAAAAASDYTHNADSASVQQQQQPWAAYASAVAAKQRASKSGSHLDDVEEDLLTASMLHGQSHAEEEYAAVFVSASQLPYLDTCPAEACAAAQHQPLPYSTLQTQQETTCCGLLTMSRLSSWLMRCAICLHAHRVCAAGCSGAPFGWLRP
jgi:hypothetical protein